MDCGTKAATLDQGVPSSAQRVLTVKIGRSNPHTEVQDALAVHSDVWSMA